MKLSRTELRILARIKSTYPIVLEAEEKLIVAIGERPLETQNSLAHEFFDGSESKCAEAIKNLLAYQCVRIVHLHAPGDFADIDIGGDSYMRQACSMWLNAITSQGHSQISRLSPHFGKPPANMKSPNQSFRLKHILS